MTQPSNTFPWYKELWVWFFLGILGLGIIAGSTMFVIGISNPPEMVVGDYARFARGLVDTNQRASQAQKLGLTGEMRIEDGQLLVTLQTTSKQPLPKTLLVLFQHPATSEQDFVVRLNQISEFSYTAALEQNPNPRAQVIVYDLAQTWWLSTPENTLLGVGALKLFPHRL